MILSLDPLKDKREESKKKVNDWFHAKVVESVMLNKVHARKAELAYGILSGSVTINDDHPFAQEAVLRNMSVAEFARLINSKVQDTGDDMELMRQRFLLTIEGAESLEVIDEALKQLGV